MIPVGLVAGVAGNLLGGAAGGVLGGAAGGAGAAGFQAALTQAMGGGGSNNAPLEQMVEGAVNVMGGIMMKLANEAMSIGMEDDE